MVTKEPTKVANNAYRIGIDLGGTKIAGTIIGPDGLELYPEKARPRRNTDQEKGYDHIVATIADLYRELASRIEGLPHTVGIGTPGAVSRKTGLLKNSNTLCLNARPLKGDIELAIGKALNIQNDANCFAMAEARDYPGKTVFGVIMGTGCGGGIVIDGKVHTGLQSIGGEWGHHTLYPETGPQCYCGKKGCIETLISGGGLQDLFLQRFGRKIKAEQIFELARGGEDGVEDFVDQFFRNFGYAMSNLINILDPDVVVIGGGLSNLDELYTTGIEYVRQFVFSDDLETPIVRNKYGDSAGVIGAALIGI